MFDETSFSLDAFDQGAWLFLLDVPYRDLSDAQRVHVRSILTAAYSVSVAERIVVFAAEKAISVMDSIAANRMVVVPEIAKSNGSSVKVKKETAFVEEDTAAHVLCKKQKVSALSHRKSVVVYQQ